EIAGADVELDKSIIEAIGDPLTHLVRNAVDHGMEDAATRERLGKPARGTVRLSAFHQSGRVNIRVQDDGGGMDPAELKEIAVSKGLITSSQAETMPDRDAYNLIFLPGFTRAQEVTDLSGRGVGMDVVRTTFKKLGGTVEVASRLNEGTTITIVLPLTLAIVPALIVAVGKVCFAVPQANIDEVVWLHGEDLYQGLKKVDDQEVYWLREHLLPVLRLSRILGIPLGYLDPSSQRELSDRRAQEPDRRSHWVGVDTDSRAGPVERRQSLENSAYILVIRSGEERYGLLVERIVDTEEIVVKSLHDQLKGCGAYSGTTVLGDGRIAMILDVAGVAEVGNLRFPERDDDAAQERASADARQTLLLFDLGGKECFAMPLSLVSRVEEIRPDDIHSANGRRYFEFRGQPVPLLALENCLPDTEAACRDDDIYVIMPRGQRPIGLLAARILDTRELEPEAELRGPELTGVLGSTLIDGRLTTVLDLVPLIESVDPNWYAPEGASGRRVLLIEDSSFFASMITPGIRGVGLDVVWVPDAESALELLRRESFETVVCDIELPGISGLEFARKVRADEKLRSQPMVAISALDTPALDAEALAAGFDRFVSKLDQGLLFRALEFLCTGKVPVRGGEVA
ncbi:MAG: hybrid sensor histidine kinase/response regulator, partial [Planctomycetota bacterium]